MYLVAGNSLKQSRHWHSWPSRQFRKKNNTEKNNNTAKITPNIMGAPCCRHHRGPPTIGPPSNPPDITALMYSGFKGTLNWSSLTPRDACLSDSGCHFRSRTGNSPSFLWTIKPQTNSSSNDEAFSFPRNYRGKSCSLKK